MPFSRGFLENDNKARGLSIRAERRPRHEYCGRRRNCCTSEERRARRSSPLARHASVAPLRITKIIPEIIRQSSPRTTPWESGKEGSIRRSRARDSQIKSRIEAHSGVINESINPPIRKKINRS
jgi:hypothetical protein